LTAISHAIGPADAGRTLEAVLRKLLPGHSWEQVRRVVAARRVRLGRPPAVDLCLDPARRIHEGEIVQVDDRSAPPIARPGGLVVRHLDSQVVVVEKPSGLNTVRHPSERQWRDSRREFSPCLDEMVARQISRSGPAKDGADPRTRLRIVHRIDKETSGLVVFARTADAERALGAQFRAHTVKRRYLAIVTGHPGSGTVRSWLVRDRGDGRRGSGNIEGVGREATTHVKVIEKLNGFSLVECRLETGRTHQIRIHMAELGHPVCGDPVYHLRADGRMMPDESGAPRLALHATELGFVHPRTEESVDWEMPLPADLAALLEALREGGRGPGRGLVAPDGNADADSMDDD
jgi:23S rRNA pseudouridine1911/1915/1917 synthase